jgi:hypothetical protein
MKSKLLLSVGMLAGVVAVCAPLAGQNPDAGLPLPTRNGTLTPVPGGPAPKHDLNGAWIGPNGPSKVVFGAVPPMTPLGEQRFKLNKPEGKFAVAGSNDPTMLCDPQGFPRLIANHGVTDGGLWFEQVPNRIVMLYQNQRTWRDIWMDGRELPKQVDAKGAPDSAFYGYSVGRWDGDYTLVIDTTGADERTWLDQTGHPHSADMDVEERYTRIDQKNLTLTVTVDDPKIYTKPFQLLQTSYIWLAKQDFRETICVPSEALEYMNALGQPAGTGNLAK